MRTGKCGTSDAAISEVLEIRDQSEDGIEQMKGFLTEESGHHGHRRLLVPERDFSMPIA